MQVKVKIRPEQSLPFPGICVYCAKPAVKDMALRKRIGRVTRRVAVPVCADCYRELHHLSAQEERIRNVGRLAAGGLLLLVLAVVLLLTPAGLSFLLRLMLALLAGLVAAEGAVLWFRRLARRAASPAKQAILNAAVIVHFSWRATTFDFVNETFAERFKQLNEPYLMEL